MVASAEVVPWGPQVPNSCSVAIHVGDASEMRQVMVATALMELGRRLPAADTARFTSDLVADTFLREDPFAFLVAVLLNQGVPAQRAFDGPRILSDRLGHLEPSRIARRPAQVLGACRTGPSIHRFPSVVAGWIVAAARRVVREHDGVASRLWSDAPTARELMSRLQAFDGIGQKKAAMTVELLASNLGVEVRDMDGSDVAYDVHVRRVFVRSGLARRDTVADVVAAARRTHPERPGALDVPAWTVGRHWCRPRVPVCGSCPIAWACHTAAIANGHGHATSPR